MDKCFDEVYDVGVVYSNSDHKFNEKILDIIKKNNKTYAEHCAWDHWGEVWFEDGLYKERVWVNKIARKVIENKNIEFLIENVNKEFGLE